MFCQKCGGKNEATSLFCSSCGTAMKKSRKLWLWISIVFTVFILAGVGYVLVQVLNEKKPSEVVATVVAEPPKEVEQVIQPVVKKMERVESLEKEKTAVIKESLPKVFTIFTQGGHGSGFLYKKGGLVVTNAHVVVGYTDVIVRDSSGKDTPGQVIGISDLYDVALIRVADYVNAEPLTVELEESAIGTEVIALGSPQGFENSASVGYLTGINRNIDFDFSYENVYQVDAQIDQGSSGGPLLDAKTGKVIGINSLLYTNKNNFAFSIPMYSMVDLLDSWAKSPMTNHQVAGVFGFYDEYTDDSATTEAEEYYEEYIEEQEVLVTPNAYFDENELESFILEFRDKYAMALQDEDFSWIQDMVLPGSAAYSELEDYVAEITGQGMTFNFTNNTVTGIEIGDQIAYVSTFEQFDFITATGELIYYEREKDYTIIVDEYGYYQITYIHIY